MTEMKARLVDKDGNPLGTAANPLKISGDVGGGVPDGGTTGQVLKKKSNTDQDTEWGDGSGGGTWGSITGTLSDQIDLDTELGSKATKTDYDLTLYVYEDATGSGDGSSKANGFTTLQAAIDAIPDVSQNVTIIVSKGSTNYLGDTTTIQKASVKSLTIQGEFYAYEACDANAVAGKVVDASADFSNFAVGDRVVCTKYSGTVGASAIEDYFYATITEVGSGYVQTSEETKVPTTGWKYLINQTVFDGDNQNQHIIKGLQIHRIVITGISLLNTPSLYSGVYLARVSASSVTSCILYNCHKGIYGVGQCNAIWPSYCAIIGTTAGIQSEQTSPISALNCTLVSSPSGTTFGIYEGINGGPSEIRYSGFFGFDYALNRSRHAVIGQSGMYGCYIDSSCTYGAYGYNITLVSCTNNAATPVYNLTSGGSIEEWDGQALPSIDDATGGQVLALKSDKSALEFATVSGGASAYGDLTDIPAAIAAIDGLTPAANKIPYYTASDAGALADLPSGYNYIINPSFEVNQRGVASVNTQSAFAVDMWKNAVGGTSPAQNTLSQQAFIVGQTDVPGEPTNYIRCVTVAGGSDNSFAGVATRIESVKTLAGQTATISFWAKADAARQIAVNIYQIFGGGGSSAVGTAGQKVTLSTTWTKFTLTFSIPSISGKTIGTSHYMYPVFWTECGATYNTESNSLGHQSGTFEFANVKLEAGSVATPFVVPTYADELRKCQRYCKALGGNTAYEILTGGLGAASTTVGKCVLQLDPPMRATPTVIAPANVANFALYDLSGGGAIAVNGTIAVDTVVSGPRILVLSPPVASGLTQYRPYALVTNNQTTDRLILSAEL